MKPIVFAMPGNETLAQSLAAHLSAEFGASEIRQFPDGESYVRLDTPVANRAVILACTLDGPDDKFLPLSFMAATARELGAAGVGLVCPYLAYMRQDRRFRPGEAITSVYFSRLLGGAFDWLVTVDPHLHRHHSLAAIVPIPTVAVHAAPLLASWVRANVRRPILIGPDSESEQWVADVAVGVGAPYAVLEKTRKGDRDVEITIPDLGANSDRIPVLVDDIISTGRTMIAAIRRLAETGYRSPVCLGVHAILAGDAYSALRDAGAASIVTCNSISHPSNAIDITGIIAAAALDLLKSLGGVA